MLRSRWTFIVVILPVSLAAQQPDLSFHPAREGLFAFDTGAAKGTIRVTEQTHGINSLVESKTGLEVAHGGNNPGILSYYRCFTTSKRYPDWRESPSHASILPNGALQVHWPPKEGVPYIAWAVYRWTSPDTLDIETTVQASRRLPDFEVFLSSYFSPGFEGYVHVRKPEHNSRPDGFVKADANPLVLGTYLLFPRDRTAARLFFDGRWQFPPNPVQWSLMQYYGLPLAMKRNAEKDVSVLIMAPRNDCLALEMPYDMHPPDGVAGHYSLYLSLFGYDVAAGSTVRAKTRMVVRRVITEENAVQLYEDYVAGLN